MTLAVSPRRESTTRRVNDLATSSSTSSHQRCLCHDDVFDCTHNAIPPKTKPIPIQVSREMTLPSAHHSPNTVNRKASEFVMGTVRLSSAFPTSKKNQILPVRLMTKGIAYAGVLSRFSTVQMALEILACIQL